jgi:hypothetical protein
MIAVSVQWEDGYMEQFDASDVRFGCDLLWMRLESGSNRHIPLRSVRWFSVNPESHEESSVARKDEKNEDARR